MSLRVMGQVREAESQNGLPNLVVQAMDADFLSNQLLGEATTNPDGSFAIEYTEEAGKDLFADKPDIYLVVKSRTGKVLKTTLENIRLDVSRDIKINVDISRPALVSAGLSEQEPAEWVKDLSPEYLKKFTAWTWQPGYDEADGLVIQLQNDLAGKSSVLELMKDYLRELKGNLSQNALPLRKLAKLFELGVAPKGIDGHFYGVPVGIRTGDQKGFVAEFGNTLGFLWGITMADICPWAGKSFSQIDEAKLGAFTNITPQPGSSACLGINHFNKINLHPLNAASYHLLNWWMGLEYAPQSAQVSFGHEKDGGNFIALAAPSVYHGTNREVFQLNYRWKNLGNPPPFRWLIDELVQIAGGLYLGQLLFATKRLPDTYDPQRPPSDYRYQHFGYFLLFDETWNPEARRLLSHLEMPVTAPGLRRSKTVSYSLPKFSAFTFEEPVPPSCNDEILAQIRNDLQGKPTIMHLLKQYSDELQGGPDNNSPYFLRLLELFNRGIGIREVKGFYRGALVSGHTEGLMKFLNLNTINLAWMKLGRFFSPWTGKSFENIDIARIKEMTDGHEEGELPTRWGTNTQSLRTPKEQFTGKLMQLAGVWTQDVPKDEAREFGYDIKCFFFIAHQAKSISGQNQGKTVFQFNYRWPKLRTIPPDCYCIDELVQIAEGLYLGQLMYATELLKPYDPLVSPEEYKYRLFGYFLLMDESWHQIRLDLGFDMGNT